MASNMATSATFIIVICASTELLLKLRTEQPEGITAPGKVRFVFGPSKTSKTIVCEILGLAIAAGFDPLKLN